ncbi:hypothetical protein ABW20_dc0107236 [Dactylellina cionopaga]|nr:hypothetical protein ABW20_dc0107236 [Dactylellina cionopaga]
MGSDKEEETEEEHDRENEERVFALVGGMARFMPQWDQQILGPENTFRIKMNHDDPPKPTAPDQLESYCNDCEVTWLVDKKAARPPAATPLTILSTASTKEPAALFWAAIGVFFGLQSPHNRSQTLGAHNPTNQVAEIAAAVEAMRYARTTVVPRRKLLVKAASQGSSRHAIQSTNHFRLILCTDSSYLVECVCKHMDKWTFNEVNKVYRNRQGQVQNGEGFRQIREERDKLSMVGVQVVWYHVPRRFNIEADRLANIALDSGVE